jgi:cytochrome b
MGAVLPSPSAANLVRVRIWDLPTRLFHWLLAACVVASIVSAKIGGNAMVWHFRFGYVLLGLLSFRIIWGVIGGRWSRFRSFVKPPAEIVRHLRGGAATPVAGHNPLGALSVLAMLGVLAAQAGSGLFADDEIANSGPLMPLVSGATSSLLTTWHKAYGQWIVIGLVVLHVCAVLWYLWPKRVNLVTPMITGDKHLPPDVPATADGWPQRAAALVVAALCTLGIAALLRYAEAPVG